MEKVSIAALRRASHSLRGKGTEVTIDHLALEVGVTIETARNYVTRVTGLAQELGVVRRKPLDGAYVDSMRLLAERDVLVTLRRVAVLSKASENTVRNWLKRHEASICEGLCVVKTTALHRHRIVNRVKWLRVLYPGKQLTVCFVARCMHRDRNLLRRMMKNDPELRKQLGF